MYNYSEKIHFFSSRFLKAFLTNCLTVAFRLDLQSVATFVVEIYIQINLFPILFYERV